MQRKNRKIFRYVPIRSVSQHLIEHIKKDSTRDTLHEHLYNTLIPVSDAYRRFYLSRNATVNCLLVGETTARSQSGGDEEKLTRVDSPPFHAATISVIAGAVANSAASNAVGGWSAISFYTRDLCRLLSVRGAESLRLCDIRLYRCSHGLRCTRSDDSSFESVYLCRYRLATDVLFTKFYLLT